MKLEVGGGEKPIRPHWKQCDIRNLPTVDFCCNALDIKKQIPNNTVEIIYSRHFLEHMTFIEGEKLLTDWYDILKPTGCVELEVPNITFHINQWINNRNDPKQIKHAKAGFWGWQGKNPKRQVEFDLHKAGYDKQEIRELITRIGFINFKSLNPETSPHLHILCYKP